MSPTMATERDVPMNITAPDVSAERRITPSWSISQLKAKLESVTGVPPGHQRLILRVPGTPAVALAASDEDSAQLSNWTLVAQAQIEVEDTRPASQRSLDLADLASVSKYTMPEETYESLPSTVLAWKKANGLGRFDPAAPLAEQQKVQALWNQITAHGIEVGKRCQLGTDSARRGKVVFVGEVPEIPGSGEPWIGIELDEPSGRNDGSIGGKRYFHCAAKKGVFVRPGRVEMGHFGVLSEADDDALEEI